MSTSGQYNYKGVNAQAWAAMSLFLQYLRDAKFSSMQLEGKKFEDFTLIFTDGKKIICESKDRKQKFSYSHLRDLLKKISNKTVLGKDDEILVICTNANDDVISEVRHTKYSEEIKSKFVKKGLNQNQLQMLPKVNFWVVPPSFNEEIIYALFSELINFWLPPNELKRFVDSILIEKIYKGSAKGETYGKADLLKSIDELAAEIKDNSTYRKGLMRREEQFNQLLGALDKPKHPIWQVTKELSAFSTDYERLAFVKDRLDKKKNELDLKNWDPLWQLNKVRMFTFGIFDIFENNLHTDANRKYVLEYIKKYTKKVRGFYQTDFFNMDVVKIVTKIIDTEKGEDYLNDSFEIVKDLITYKKNEFFYLKSGDRSESHWRKGEISKLLRKVYDLGDPKLKQEIFDLLISAFNITEDDGEFDWHTPREAYAMIRDWLENDFEKRFPILIKIISDQYSKFYKKFGTKVRFKGWEHMGGGTSYGPGGHHVGDRHFITNILSPAISKFYEEDEKRGWVFIKKYCLSPTSRVSKTRPDFLNRAVLRIVLQRFTGEEKKVSDEAFNILKEFLLSRKGIPHKTDLIYQALVGMNIAEDKKWRLVKVSTEKYNSPVNPFVEQLISELARKGKSEAKALLKKWYSTVEYYKRAMFDVDAVESISSQLETDFQCAVDLFKTLITSEYIRRGKSDRFSAFNVAKLLYEIFKKNYSTGLSIIRLLESEETLSEDQQIVYTFGLFSSQGNDDADDPELLLKVYNDVVNPFLNKYKNDITSVCLRITSPHYREAFVQLAVRLAVNKKIAEALRIIKVFVTDPDPYLPKEDHNDPNAEYNEHKKIEEGEEPMSITSVRGWCGWALMKCSVLAGREFMPEIISLTKKLVSDENYYVIHMGTNALSQLALNRLTVLPKDRSVLFLNDNKKVALEMAKDIERIAFDLLDRFASLPSPVQDAMAKSVLRAFNSIRALNKKDILKLLNTFKSLSPKTVEEAAPLFLYYAELRTDDYRDWKFFEKGLYDDLTISKKDAQQFKQITLEVMGRLQAADPDTCFRFASSAEHLMREGGKDDNEKNKYTQIALEYFDLLTNTYAHNIFNLAYRVIQTKFEQNDKYMPQWYSLLLKCFEIEEAFYKIQLKKGNIQEVYWFPSLYHSRILELVYEKFPVDDFMKVTKIFFLRFPKEIGLHESDHLVSIVQDMAKTNKDAKKILASLKKRNPSKYWGLK